MRYADPRPKSLAGCLYEKERVKQSPRFIIDQLFSTRHKNCWGYEKTFHFFLY
jgi:hypothetical protein